MPALDGIKVLDMAPFAPGTLCTMILGDMGAEVITVRQPPGSARRAVGDATTDTSVPLGERRRAAARRTSGRNKKSISLNLKHPEAKEAFLNMARDSDVLIEGFRPGVADRLGVGYEAIKEINPGIVYCSISGYGQEGPHRDLASHDVNYISMAGFMSLNGSSEETRPIAPLNIVADYAAGSMMAYAGILTALYDRERTGEGQYIDISLAGGVVYLMADSLGRYAASEELPKRGTMHYHGYVPHYAAYRTKDDKWFTIGCAAPEIWFWENLCRAIGREDLIPRRFDHDAMPILEEIFRTRTRQEWFDYLRDKNVPIGKVNTLAEVWEDEHFQQTEAVVSVPGPDGDRIRQVGVGIKMSRTPGSIRTLGHMLGEDTEEVLRSQGYSQERVEEMKQAGAVFQAPLE